MFTGRTSTPQPRNEPVHSYAPGSPERARLTERIAALEKDHVDARMRIGGQWVSSDEQFTVTAPHRHELSLATVHAAASDHVTRAIEAALQAAEGWAARTLDERAAVFLRAADLLSGPWRDTLNAATILGQSKSWHQAEIDAACELIDFLRWNVHFAEQVATLQPRSSPGVWNRMDHRPLEGFVLALTPFNFTAIAGNLPTAPALMGNVVVWKPSEKQALAAHFTMELLQAAGLPDGVINLVHGDGALVSEAAMAHRSFAGLHFTGSTAVLKGLWRRSAAHIDDYDAYPRIVGESGGKDFVVAHHSADVRALLVALVRGAFEYQGQKCSAASRAYVPRSLWPQIRDGLHDLTAELSMGDVSDPGTFMGAVIDGGAYARLRDVIARARADAGVELVAGGGCDDTDGWFVEPTVLRVDDPRSDTMVTELFGPVLPVFVYDDADWTATLDLVDTTGPYGLTGAVFATDRRAVEQATGALRQAAGNFYVNDKPTGAVVGQQPFGGARGSGTNDKAGAVHNLLRWVSPRVVKETFVPPTDWRYPHLG